MDSEANPALFKGVLTNPHLQRLNIGIFCQHFILTSTFYAVPILIQQQMILGHLHEQWHFYLPLVLFSFLMMLPLLIFSERKGTFKTIFLLSIAITILCQWALAFSHGYWLAIVGFMFAYFVVFNFLEASLPSLISKQASPNTKGTAMGIYSSSQFLGIFAGGVLAGIFYEYAGPTGIFISNGILSLAWFIVSCYIEPSKYHMTLILSYDHAKHNEERLHKLLSTIAGVVEVVIAKDERTIYLRVVKEHYIVNSAEQILKDGT